MKLLPNGNHALCVILKNTPRHVSSGCLEASWECKMPTNFRTRQSIHDLRIEIKTTTWKEKSEQIHSIIIIISYKTPTFNFPSGKRTIVLELRVSSVLWVVPSPTGITASLSPRQSGRAFLSPQGLLFSFRLANPRGRTSSESDDGAFPSRVRALLKNSATPGRARSAWVLTHSLRGVQSRLLGTSGPRGDGATGRAGRGAFWGLWSLTLPLPTCPEGRRQGELGSVPRYESDAWPRGQRSGFPGFSPCASSPACTGSSRRAPSFLCRSPEGR